MVLISDPANCIVIDDVRKRLNGRTHWTIAVLKPELPENRDPRRNRLLIANCSPHSKWVLEAIPPHQLVALNHSVIGHPILEGSGRLGQNETLGKA